MLNKLRSPSFQNKNTKAKIPSANFNSTGVYSGDIAQGYQVNYNSSGVDYQFLQAQQKKPTNPQNNLNKQKASKSTEKYQIKLVNQGLPLKDRNDSQGKNGRHESIQSKIKNKRRGQQSNVNLKENVYSPKSSHIQHNQFNNTTTAVIHNFGIGLSERQIDLSQTQNLEPSTTSQSINNNNNHTIKSSERNNQNNFDFGCQLKMPASTKHATMKQIKSKGSNGGGNIGNNYSSFFPNAGLQEFITNMTSTTNKQSQAVHYQTVSKSRNQTVQNNTTTNIASTGTLDKSIGKQRKPSNQSSKKQIVPVLDMKKLSLKQVQQMMKQKATSIRESNRVNENQQSNTRRQTDNNQTQALNQLQNIGESTLYKNLTQKLIKEQQQQQSLKGSMVQPQQQQKYSLNNNIGSTHSSKFSLLKKQATPSNKNANDLSQHDIHPAQSQERYYSNNLNRTQIQIPSASTTNKNQKSFNFDLMGHHNQPTMHQNYIPQKNQNTKKVKKMLNLTGTLPKGLLSPTNNSNNKHKHAQYFEMANNSGYNQFENTLPINLRNPGAAGSQQNQQPLQQNNNSTVQQFITFHSGCNHGQGTQYFNYNNESSGPNDQMQIMNTQQPQIAGKRQKFNQTTKIERANSGSSSGDKYSQQNLKNDKQNYKSQILQNKSSSQQPVKAFHQKTSTLPNAALLLPKSQDSQLCDEISDNIIIDFKNDKNIKSVGQTPRVQKNKKASVKIGIQPKTIELADQKANFMQLGNQNKKHLHLQIELEDEDDEDAVIDVSNLPTEKIDTEDALYFGNNGNEYDFNEVEVGIDFNKNNFKLQTQKIESQQQQKQQLQLKKEVSKSTEKSSNSQNFIQKNAQSIQQIQVQFSPKNQNQQISQKPQKRNPSAHSGGQNSGNKSINYEDISFPINPPKALKFFMNYLTDYEKGEILDYKQVYFLGLQAKKIKGSPLHPYNFGYDDDRGDYKVVLKDHIAYRFEVIEFLGKGSFGQCLKCFDHKTKEIVAVKLIRNKKRFQHQAGIELKILQHLKNHDPEDQYNIIRIKDYVHFRKHLVISFEIFSINLYEFIKNNNFQGISLSLIRRFAIQLLQSLKFLRDEKVIHCDLKPENILLKSPDKSGIKVIDFGSSCFQHERIYTYIQSRFYRAPEIILGIPYTTAIDMWSFGCILAELFTGYPIFPGESEQEQLALMMEIRDVPPDHILEQSTRRKLFFDEETLDPILVPNTRGKLRIPGSKDLPSVLRSQSPTFLDFIERCLDWDPQTRMTPYDALMHDWIIEGLPPKVLQHHKRMLGIIDAPSSNSNHSQLSNPLPQINLKSQKSVPQAPKSTKNGVMNKTCLLSEAMNKFDKITQKRGKSLNKTGMIVINENEDIVDGMSDTNQHAVNFFNHKKSSMNSCNPADIMHYVHDSQDEEDDEQMVKAKTTNVADILKEIKGNKKQGADPKSNKQMFENTYDISKLKKNSFFSQSNKYTLIIFISDNLEDVIIDHDCDYEDEEDGGALTPYDERDQQQTTQDGQGQNNKKNKIPFSFLMHHYLKTNAGQEAAAQKDPQVGFYKPKSKDVKLNNFIGAAGSGVNNVQKTAIKKGFVNLSSNV